MIMQIITQKIRNVFVRAKSFQNKCIQKNSSKRNNCWIIKKNKTCKYEQVKTFNIILLN